MIKAEKLAAAGRMAASVAHEINNPLASVMNALFLVAADENLSPATRQSLHIAEEELNRVANLTKQTLAFYKGSNSAESVSATELVKRVVRTYAHKIREKHLQLEVKVRAQQRVTIASDPLGQVLSNLLGNAIDASAPNGKLVIRARIRKLHHQQTPHLVVTIADNGSGIPPELQEKVFEPFFTNKQDIGKGLGLWVSRDMVRRLGGSLRLKSRVGQGTAFTVSLPVSTTATAAAD